MKKLILIGALLASSLSFSQYCMFFDFKTDNPEAVVTTISKIMDTEWGKNIQGTKSLFGYFFNGEYEATHSMQFCFQDEAGVANFMSSWAASSEVQQLSKELDGSDQQYACLAGCRQWLPSNSNSGALLLVDEQQSEKADGWTRDFWKVWRESSQAI